MIIDSNRIVEFAIRELCARLTPEQIAQVDKVTAAGAQLANQLARIEATQIEMFRMAQTQHESIMALRNMVNFINHQIKALENVKPYGIDRGGNGGATSGFLPGDNPAGKPVETVAGIPMAADTDARNGNSGTAPTDSNSTL